jgi:hypothetical protein
MSTRTGDPTTTPRHLASGVAVAVAACVLVLAPAIPAHAAPSDQAGTSGPPSHAASPHAASVDVGAVEITSPGSGVRIRRGSSQRAAAPGQATTPGRSGDAPGRQVPTSTSATPPAAPAPAPATEPGPDPRATAPPAAPRPAPATPAPATPAPAASAPARNAATGATDSATPAPVTVSTVRTPIPAGERATPVSLASSPPSSSALLRSSIEAAAGTAGAAGAGALASVTDATAEAARRLAGGLQGASGLAHQAPLPARDLGIPMGVLALLGAYLALGRLLDRGGLPMTISDGREDDVQLVL